MSSEDVQSPHVDGGVDNIADQLGSLNTDGAEHPRTEEEYNQTQITLRAVVTSKEAGVIIGKAGQNVADLRDKTGVRAGVSKVVPGVHDRVLTVSLRRPRFFIHFCWKEPAWPHLFRCRA